MHLVYSFNSCYSLLSIIINCYLLILIVIYFARNPHFNSKIDLTNPYYFCPNIIFFLSVNFFIIVSPAKTLYHFFILFLYFFIDRYLPIRGLSVFTTISIHLARIPVSLTMLPSKAIVANPLTIITLIILKNISFHYKTIKIILYRLNLNS